MSILIELTLRGSVAVFVIILLDRILAERINSPSRRLWWCFIPLAFLVPLRIPIIPSLGHLSHVAELRDQGTMELPIGSPLSRNSGVEKTSLELGFWLAGAFAYLFMVGTQTVRASRRWSRVRLSTDHSLLELLEDCKAETGVTAPIGLVVSTTVPSPAIMGWLRPRILLPEAFVTGSTPAELRPILLHELAHLRSFDVPFNWLLTLVRAVHWFNPLAHLGAISWTRFREEAADEAAVKWMRRDSSTAYGDALVRSLRQFQGASAPFGSLAIFESVSQLKRRINMINRYQNKSPQALLTGVISLLLAAVVCSISARAADNASSDPNGATIAAAQTFLKELDDGQYQKAWDTCTPRIQNFMGSFDGYLAMVSKSRPQLGKCTDRTSATEVVFKKDPYPTLPKGTYAYLYFDSSFSMDGAQKQKRESVILFKDMDGSWKVDSWAIDDREKMSLTTYQPK